MFRYLFILFISLAAIPAFAVSSDSRNFTFTPSVGSAVTQVVVDSQSSFATSQTYNANSSITWNLCNPQPSCDYGQYTVYVKYLLADGSEVLQADGTTFRDSFTVAYTEPVRPTPPPVVDRSPEIFQEEPVVIQEPVVVPVVESTEPVAVELPEVPAFSVTALLSSDESQKTLKDSATVLAVGQVVGTGISALLPTLSGSQLAMLPFRLWNLILVGLGLRRRMRPWGVVFDSFTKQPLDPAVVVLKNSQGEEVATSITDIDGRYGFFVEPGEYSLEVGKTNYQFPSNLLLGQKFDSVYDNLYHGEPLAMGGDAVIAKNLPMDPISSDWNQTEKQRMNRGYTNEFVQFVSRATNALFLAGFVTSLVALISQQSSVNFILIGVYITLFIFRRLGFTPRIYGRIVIGAKAASHAVVRVWNTATGTQIGRAVTDSDGHYYMLVPKGKNYTLSIELPDESGTLKPYMSGLPVSAMNGVLNKRITVPQM